MEKGISDVGEDRGPRRRQRDVHGGGSYIGTLANGGVALAPFHDFQSKVPASLQAELNTLKQQIISGKIVPATKSPV